MKWLLPSALVQDYQANSSSRAWANPARLVALNHERAEEERRGIVRWLRPEFQNPSGVKQTAIAVEEDGDEGREEHWRSQWHTKGEKTLTRST